MRRKRHTHILGAIMTMIFLVSFVLTSGCAVVKEGTMDELVGTYKLTEYTRINNDSTEDKEATKIDLLEETGIELYLVVTGTRLGYISYKSNSEPDLIVREVKLTYTYNQEDESMVQHVAYDFQGASKTDFKTYMGMLGFLSGKKALNYTDPKYSSYSSGCTKEYDDKIYFEKVSKEVDLKYIKSQYPNAESRLERYIDGYVGKFYDFNPYSQNYLTTYVGDNNGYIYKIIAFDDSKQNATIYYATKADKTPQEKSNLPVKYNYIDDKTNIESIEIDGTTYLFEGSLYYGSLKIETSSEEENAVFFYRNDGFIDINEEFEYRINQYIEFENSQIPQE